MAASSSLAEIIASSETPQILKDYISYIQVIKGKSANTAQEYFFDLRMFFRYIKMQRNNIAQENFSDISIADVDTSFIRSITLSDAYAFLLYTANQRVKYPGSKHPTVGLGAAARARKTSSLRQFFKYACDKAHIIDVNPLQSLETPKVRQSLPKYLTMQDCKQMLAAVDGPFRERDYCILMLFLNCGLRVSELCSMNTTDIQGDRLRVLGKGNKERILFLNDLCLDAINAYLPHRIEPKAGEDPNAMFVSRNRRRMHRRSVELMVENTLKKAGLAQLSPHKLRHTSASNLLHAGVDIRTIQSILGHSNLGTTQIYTHLLDSDLKEAMEKQAELFADSYERDREEDAHSTTK